MHVFATKISASLAEIFVSRKSFVTLQTEMTTEQLTAEEMAQEVKRLTGLLAAAGHKDLLLPWWLAWPSRWACSLSAW